MGLLHASVAWAPNDSSWSVGLWARNLTNEKYLAATTVAAPSFAFGVFGPPREYGLELKVEF